jgi:outer membrane protein
MRKLLRSYLPALVLTSLLSGSAWAQTRIATVDLPKIFDNYWKKKQAEASLKERGTDMEKELKNMQTDFTKAQEDYKAMLDGANDSSLSPEEREKRKRAAEEKLKRLREQDELIRQYIKQSDTTLKEQGLRMRGNIIKEIKNVVSGKAKAAGFTLVIDTAAEGVSGPYVLYTNNENDMTDAVLLQLNATAPTELPKTDEKAEPKKDEKK